MRWLGLTGKMGAGKDYTFSALKEMTDNVVRVGFADALKAEVTKYLQPADPTFFWNKPYSDPVRRLLQWWGTDFRRAEDPDYWVNMTERYALKQEPRIPVFTDVRFPNEADMIRRNGGLIVRVQAPPEVREKRLGMVPPSHASETEMDYYDVDMHVTSTVENEAYEGQVRRILVEATFDDVDFMGAIRESLDVRG